MSGPWLILYWLLAALAILQAALIALQTWEHRRYARRRLSELRLCRASGRALVVVPCRGHDIGLEDNLSTLLEQDYDDYLVRFVVESLDDPACEAIRRVMREHSRVRCELIVAGGAEQCGQKVHNLLAATSELPPEVRYLAFVDSDARPQRHWLRALLGQLELGDVGAATGYRWFVPVRPSLANHLVYSINCNSAIMMAAKVHHFVWGGSWAMRREVFESIGLRQAWQGTLSDDLVVGRLLKRAGHRVVFEPACMVASPVNLRFGPMLRFIRRQYVIARWYVPRWWAFALAAVLSTNLAMFGCLAGLASALATGSPPVWGAAAVCAALYGVTVYRGLLRRDLALCYFPSQFVALGKAARFDTWASPLANLVHAIVLVSSAVGRSVTWRGISYRLLSGGKVRLTRRREESSYENERAAEETLKALTLPGPLIRYRKAG